MFKQPDWSFIHEKKGFRISLLLLAPMAFFYGLGVRLRLALIKRKKKKELPGFVVSIGNLTTGGTGKTPAAMMIAEWALGKGYRAAILSRGYKGNYKGKVSVVTDGKHIKAGPKESGDEPYLMARSLNGVPVVISKDRYLAGITANKNYRSNFFILDDGFQHIRLKRDLDLVLVDAQAGTGNGHLLPWGPLREPVSQLKRADGIIFTRSGNQQELDDSEIFQDIPCFTGDHIPLKIIFPFGNRPYEPQFLKGKRVLAFAGIARPGAFRDTLTDLGAELAGLRVFMDHHSFGIHEILNLKEQKEELDAELLVTTEKDWIRLEGLGFKDPDLAYLTVGFALVSGRDEFYDLISEKLKNRGDE